MKGNLPTMSEHAQRWVDSHLETCTSPTCGCHVADRNQMVDALIARWLEMEP